MIDQSIMLNGNGSYTSTIQMQSLVVRTIYGTHLTPIK